MSLAQGYIKGLSLGQQLKDAERQRQRDELSDELIRERIADSQFQRKTLMSQLKEQEEKKRREAIHRESGFGLEVAQAGVGARETYNRLAPGLGDIVENMIYAKNPQYNTGAQVEMPTIPGLGEIISSKFAPKKEGAERALTDDERYFQITSKPPEKQTQADKDWLQRYFHGTGAVEEEKTPRERISARQIKEVTKAQSIPPNFVLQIYKTSGTKEEQATADTMYAETMARQFNIPVENALPSVQELGKFNSYDSFIDSPVAQNYEQTLSDEAFDKLKEIAKWFYGEKEEDFGWEQFK